MLTTSFGFELADIEILQFALFEKNRKAPYSDEYLIDTKLDFALDMEERGIRIFVDFLFEQDGLPQIKIEVACDYYIDESTWSTFQFGDEMTLSRDFASHLSTIAIGAVRGILKVKTDRTIYQDFLLPLVNIGELVKTDIHFAADE